jgi:hypothetical protein
MNAEQQAKHDEVMAKIKSLVTDFQKLGSLEILFKSDEKMLSEIYADITKLCAKADIPAGFTVVPDYRGYAHLGTGNYLINHSASGAPAELVISIAGDTDKAGRAVGDDYDNLPGQILQPEQMCVRIRFENAAGLDALEKQLAYLREVHFGAKADSAEQVPVAYVHLAPDDHSQSYDVRFWAKVPMGTKLYAVPLNIAQQAPEHDFLSDGAMKRLRLICKLLGLENAIPDNEASLRACEFSVLGMVRSKIEDYAALQSQLSQAQEENARLISKWAQK